MEYKVPKERPPRMNPPVKQPCEHKWVFQCSDFQKGKRSQYKDYFKRIDTFYCEKCLEIKEVVVKEEDTFGDKPYWYKG